jgi:uncharacterized membrane protein YfcA
MDSQTLLLTTATFFLAGLVKGVTGMGLPTVAMGLLGGLLTPLTAANLLIVPSFVTNIWQLVAGPSFTGLARRLWPMLLALTIGTLIGATMLASGDTALTTRALGAALALYALVTLLARPFTLPPKLEPWLAPIIGVTTGLVTGGTGVFVIPAVPYLQALGLEKDALIQALGLSFTTSTIALAVALAGHGAFRIDNMALSALAVLPAVVGLWVGTRLRHRIAPASFRRWFLVGLLLLGAEMVVRAR